tara:strand:- start:1828 stop:2070 length:243 start_codon:yes stop_codon:yes gene_type:complete
MQPEIKAEKKTAKKKAEPKAPAQPTVVMFRSAEMEPTQFEIRGAMAARCQDGRIEWEFSSEEAEIVRRHSHILSGRIVEV